MKTSAKRPRLPIPIPYDLAGELGCHPSFIGHMNAGDKPVPLRVILRLLEISLVDNRLADLTVSHLWPEIGPLLDFNCNVCPWKARGHTNQP